jgi:hypothetical protein
MMQIAHMEWKQPEGFRRHWVLEELDAELLFLQMPVGAAQGRVGDDVYDLRDGGTLRRKRTLSVDKTVLATLEEKAAGTGGILRRGEEQYEWKQENLFGTRWVLKDGDGKVIFAYVSKQGLGKVASVQTGDGAAPDVGPLLLLCWYVTVL